ncbi:MAG: hypothetical protein HDKAJFGB_00895 [Anaerolineae bacterium]|nr:hypothetical protein [Anaerolineae bacterium]
MLLTNANTRHISTLTHEGKVLIAATVFKNGITDLYYTVKQDGFEDKALQNPNGTGWETFKKIPLPNDSIGDPSVVEKEKLELTDKSGNQILRSLYATAGLTDNSPVQLVSHDGHVYLFRRSTSGTLLVDRFVLDGMTNTLTPKIEVRFKRSRQRYKPFQDMKINNIGQLESADALDFRDMNGSPFYAPTIELFSSIGGDRVIGDSFAVVITAATEPDNYRWHIFSHVTNSSSVHLLTVRADNEYIFDIKDYWSRGVDPVTEVASYNSIPGLLHRTIELRDSGDMSLSPQYGLAAVKYDVQRERETQDGARLGRDESKALLAVPTEKGIAVLAFAIAADGTLAQIQDRTTSKILSDRERQILLPLDLLDDIRGVGTLSPTPGGKIVGMSRSVKEDAADRVQVSSSDPRVQDLSRGDLVELTNTQDYNGLYPVTYVDKDTFIVDSGIQGDGIGDWVKVELEESGLVFDGQLLAYEIQDNKLKVTAHNHGLANGDSVQIVGSSSYDGKYPVLEHDDHTFTVQRLWATGQAVNVKVESRKRRGLILDGAKDWIYAPFSKGLKLKNSFTFEVWVKLDSLQEQVILVIPAKTKPPSTDRGAFENMGFAIHDKTLALALNCVGHDPLIISDRSPADTSGWVHLAAVYRDKSLEFFKNGDKLKTETLTEDSSFTAGALILGAFLNDATNAAAPSGLLKGQLAEARLWMEGRTAKQIKDTMYLQLTGRERGLAGYWRLGGVAVEDDGAKRVYDFAVNANHGTVHGDPSTGGVVLNRKLADNETPVVKFVSDEHIVVREGATYLESFEFRAKMSDGTSLKTVSDAGGENTPIFTPSLWGRLSRDSEDKITIKPLDNPNFEFEDKGDGWWSAACRFIAPEGVRLLRCFEVRDVQGNWSTLEVRRLNLKLVSDTVTLVSSDGVQPVKLESLAGGPSLAETLREFDKLQRKEALLASQIAILQRKVEDARRSDLPRKIQDQTAVVKGKESALANANQVYMDTDKQQRGSYFNDADNNNVSLRGTYIDNRPVLCPPGKIVTGISLSSLDGWRQDGSGGELLTLEVECAYPDGSGKEYVKNTSLPDRKPYGEIFHFPEYSEETMWVDTAQVQIPTGRYVTGVQFFKKWVRDPESSSRLAVALQTTDKDGQDERWDFGPSWDENPAGAFRSEIGEDTWRIDTNRLSVLSPSRTGVPPVLTGIWLWQKQVDKYRIAAKIGFAQLDKIEAAQKSKNLAFRELEQARAALRELQESSQASQDQVQAWQDKITNLQSLLDNTRAQLSDNTIYLSRAAQAQSAQVMPALTDAQNPRGLTVQGAFLPSAVPATPLQAIESCTGHVTLTYMDKDGALCQTRYDTTYDADGKGEEWIPDNLPTAIEFAGTTPPTILPTTAFVGLDRQITIEFWSRGDTRLPLGTTFLAAANKDNKTALRIQLPNEKGEVVWEAGDASGATLDRIAWDAEERLYRGYWTHWTFVKDAGLGEMRIYVNGKLVHKNKPQTQDDDSRLRQPLTGITQAALGGTLLKASESGWQGQIAALRIWDVALGSREIEANSRLPLLGNEPGLRAFYLFNEAQGNEARDLTGQCPALALTNATWVPCPAPFGQLVPEPIYLLDSAETFDAKNPLVDLPPLNLDLANGLTIQARVRLDAVAESGVESASTRAATIFALGNGDDGKNIVVGHSKNRTLTFQIYDRGKTLFHWSGQEPAPQSTWFELTAVLKTDGDINLYVNGEIEGFGYQTMPLYIASTDNYLGKSEQSDSLFEGAVDFLRLYEYAMDDNELSARAGGLPVARQVITTEYSRVRVDAQNQKSAMMLRAVVMPTPQGVQLLDEQRIEELETKWISNTQIQPTLIGYIEGAPPIPTENLTQEQDYNGATSVELVQSSDVEYSWTREQDLSTGATLDLLIGAKSETSAGGIGIITSVEEVHSGAGGHLDFAYHWQNASAVGASHSLMKTDRLALTGGQEEDARFPHLGPRFIPKDIGYAVVISGLGDLFVTQLKRSGRVMGYQVLPVQDVPLDVNTVTFLINPAYTMSGSLDGMTGSRATSERFFSHVPHMRSQYGSLYPASYFRLKEAYDLKARIDQQDEQRQAYFEQFNSHLVDQWSMQRQASDSGLDGATVGVNAEQSAGSDLAKKMQEISAAEKKLEQLEAADPPDLPTIKQARQELDRLREEREALKKRQEGEQQARREKGQARLGEIEKTYNDPSTRAHASDSFHAWQKKMEDLQIRAGKRNIVNTYVWDADGGFHAEEQQFASAIEHSIGGSFDLAAALGGQATVAISKVLVAFNTYAQFNMTQTMSKAESGGKALELHVDLSGVESRGITDFRDNPILPGEKVDRYRFMSFFLENSVDHWHDFFNYVVNPEWLASNDEEARALRQTQSALPNKVWRVLHRVTYVERPALMGFGRNIAASNHAADDIRELRQQVDDLKTSIAKMQQEINAKLDKLLSNKV